jgi:RNA polymerase sigma-70 factor (ECF subfamily)
MFIPSKGRLSMTEESKILAALKSNRPEALGLLFEAYADRIYRLGLRLLQNPVEAEDVVQETFLKALTHIESFKGHSKLGTWLYRIAYNASMDRLRALPFAEQIRPNWEDDSEPETLIPEVFVEWRTPEQLLMSSETVTILDEVIERVPEGLRAVFILRDIEELSTNETAEILSISPGAVKVRLHRARLLLREMLAAEFNKDAVKEGMLDEV